MKPKNNGIVAAAMYLTAIICLFGYGYFVFTGEKKVTKRQLAPLPMITVPQAPVLKTMAQLEKEASKLAHPLDLPMTDVDIGILGYRPLELKRDAKQGSRTSGKKGAGMLRPSDYEVSFVLITGKKKLCMVDDQFQRVGDTLKGGETIVAIESYGICIEQTGRKRWVYVSEPTG